MRNPDEVLKELFEEECRARSEHPVPELSLRPSRKPVWNVVSSAAAAALVLSAFMLGMQYRQPSGMDSLIARNLPEEEQWERALAAGSRFVVTALEGVTEETKE